MDRRFNKFPQALEHHHSRVLLAGKRVLFSFFFGRGACRFQNLQPRLILAHSVVPLSLHHLGGGVSLADVPADLPRRRGSGGDGTSAGLPRAHAAAEQVPWKAH